MEIENFAFVDGRLPEEKRPVWEFFVRKDTQDKNIVSEVILENPYQVANILNMAGIQNPKAIVDLGGHIGSFAKSTALQFPDAQIFSYEATEENFNLLKKNTENISNINIYNTIVCGSRKPAKIWWDKKEKPGGVNTGGTRVIYEGDTLHNDLEDMIPLDNIKSTSLEEIMEVNNLKQIDYLKMDIEGSEFDVIKAAKESGVLKKVKCMVCELHVNQKRGRFFGDFISHLDDFQFLRATNRNNYRIVYAIQ